MVTLGKIRGQERVVDFLRRAVAQARVPHAYLFTGPPGVGKHTTGLALAAAMNCEVEPGEGCGSCAACERIAGGIHPDVVTLERQGPSQTIPIEVIRRQVIPALGLAPHEAKVRFFLVEEATSLLGPSANAMLKTLEEPPARTHFILCTGSVGELLPTIKSRCQRVVFQPLPAGVKAELEGDSESRLSELVEVFLNALDRGDRLAIAQVADRIAAERGEVARVVRLCAQRLHGMARAAAEAGDVSTARARGSQALRALDCEFGLTEHNAHGLLAIEKMAREMIEAAP